MGIMDAIGAGLGAAGGALADIGMAQVKSSIEEERQGRLAEMQSQLSQKTHAANRESDAAAAVKTRNANAESMKAETSKLDDERIIKSYDKDFGAGAHLEDFGDRDNAIKSLRAQGNSEMNAKERLALTTQAGVNTGLIGSLDAAKMARDEDKADRAAITEGRKQDSADARLELDSKKLDQMIAAAKSGDKVQTHMAIATFKQDLDALDKKWEAARKDLVDAKKNMRDEEVTVAQDNMASIEAQAASVRSQRNEMYTALKLPHPKDEPVKVREAPLQDVRVGGKVIGQARTQAEAAALVAANKKK